MERLARFFPQMKPAWTKQAKLPGGDFEMSETLFKDIVKRYSWLGAELITRLQNSYGTLTFSILGEANKLTDLGLKFGHNLYQKEVDYLCHSEWARSTDDILWRRSKLGYYLTTAEQNSLSNYLRQTPRTA